MLKNIAIPLMLAASEAEAQKKPTQREVQEAIEGDLRKKFDGLIASEAACTKDTDDTATTNIATLSGTVDTKQAEVDRLEGLIDAATKEPVVTTDDDGNETETEAGGAWFVANKNRNEAVAAALALEAEADIAGKLNDVDSTADLERAAAQAYLVAQGNFHNAEVTQGKAQQTWNDADSKKGDISDAKDDATTAVNEAWAQLTKEKEWREWRFCELGALPAGSSLGGDWWGQVTDPNGVNGAVYGSEPDYCTVPKVPSTCDETQTDNTQADYCTRKSIKYYGKSGDGSGAAALTGAIKQEFNGVTVTDDGRTRFTANLNNEIAQSKKDAQSTTLANASINSIANGGYHMNGLTQQRDKAGEVAWLTGRLKQATWKKNQRDHELAFYNAVKAYKNYAKTDATKMADSATAYQYDIPAAADQTYTSSPGGTAGMASSLTCATSTTPGCMFWQNTATGVGTAGAGPSKALGSDNGGNQRTDRTYLRDTTTAGGKTLPFARGADSGTSAFKYWNIAGSLANCGGADGWKWTPSLVSGDIETWETNNTSAGAVHNWWAKAKVLSSAVKDWWATYTDNTTKIQGDTVANVVTTSGGGNGPCDTTGAGWSAVVDTTAADIAGCLTACKGVNTALVGEASTDWFQPDADINGAGDWAANANLATNLRMARYSSGTKVAYCGAYSYNNGGSTDQKCYNLLSSGTVTATANDVADSQCGTLTDVIALGEAQGAAQAAWADGLSDYSLHDLMVTDINAQATLEKNWLEAWYLVYYWSRLAAELEDTASGSTAETYATKITTVSGGTTTTDATTAGAEHIRSLTATALETAEGELAAFDAAIETTQAAVTALGTRIDRADAQIAELEALVTSDAAGTTSDSTGTLNIALQARVDELAAYVAADGEWGIADQALTDANLAIVAGDDTTGQTLVDDGNASDPPVLVASGTPVPDTSMWKLRWDKLQLWNTAISNATGAETALTDAITGDSLETLRSAVVSTTGLWSTQNDDLEGNVGLLLTAEGELQDAKDDLAEAVLNCQIAAYNKYRSTLEDNMTERLNNLKTIKTMLEDQETPAPGTAGARCEKALSNGTFRPQRGVMTCGGEESGLCCGAARVWMAAGTNAAGVAVSDAMWRTIETCQLETATSYDYQPARAPMAVEMPATVSVDFTCIEGAKKLAAAASAVAAAVYMLA